MCGIAGAVSLAHPLAPGRLKPMVDAIGHRGPDDSGFLVWQSGKWHPRCLSYGVAFNEIRFRPISPLLPSIDSREGQERLREDHWDVFLGHRRLAIIDLSARGHQPMTNRDQSLWVVFNGEVYNYRELRRELEQLGYHFVSNSDTEVLLHAYDAWGEDAVERFNGMFAFALWDARRKRLWLVRDRYGIKPLYYSCEDGLLLFGSEIKSLLPYLQTGPDIDLEALNSYFTFQNCLDDRTLFAGVRMLPAGTSLSVDVLSGKVRRARYWDFDFSRPSDLPRKELEDRLYQLIVDAVRRQCVSDVPIGSYLSGGLDSGTVAAVTAGVFGRIFTFTAGFDLSEAAQHEASFDEREQAERMANLLRSEHYECVLHAGDMEAVLDKLVWHLEDLRVGQCYPNYYVARLVSKFVKVVMSGVGGDELFGGYPWRYAAALGGGGADWTENYYHYWQRLIADEDKPRFFNQETTRRFKDAVGCSFGEHSLAVFRNVFADRSGCTSRTDLVNRALYFECKTFLHGLLVVEDKLSMAFGLETRVPFLDNDLVDFACRIPVRHKVSGLEELERIDENMPRKKEHVHRMMSTGKTILRQAMQRILGPETLQAKKQGFSAPDESWFRGSSADPIRTLLLSPGSRVQEFLNMDVVKRLFEDHVKARVNKRLLIWSLVCLECWLRQFPRALSAGQLSQAA
jgi:asparagine synthase (glutamine-hydrolysing)